MRRLATTAGLLALLALTPAACKQSDSIVLVYVFGPKALMPQQLRVTVNSGLDTRSFYVPPTIKQASDVITLPASFTIAFDRSHGGPITVSIDALGLDMNGNTVPLGFSGTTMMQHINIGDQTDIAVYLTEGLPPDQIDGGADGPSDANEGGAAGAGGSGGAGSGGGGSGGGGSGGAGQGGAAGQNSDAASDADGGDDATGLDGAAD